VAISLDRSETVASGWIHRLGTQLVLGFLGAALVPSLLVGGLLTWGGLQLAQRSAQENVARTAAAYGADLDLFVQRQRGLLVRMGQAEPASETFTAAVRTIEGLEAVWDPSAGVSSSPPPAGWARAACEALDGVSGQDVTHAGAGHAHEVVVRVSGDEGVLCGQLAFTLHQEMLTEQATSFLGGRAYIVDASGTVVCHTFEDGGHHDPRGQQLSTAVAAIAQDRTDWSGRAEGPEGDVVAAYAPSTELEWGVWVEVPVSRALGPYWTGLWRSALVAAAVAALAAGLAVLLARRLAAPVRSVASAVGRLAVGELGAAVPVRGPAEIAVLAREFNKMSRALARSHAELEARVAERTEELSAARAFSDNLLDTMRHEVVVFDTELRVVRANAAAVAARRSPGSASGEAALSEVRRETLRRVVAEARPCREERMLGSDHRVLDVEAVPVLGEEGLPIGVLEVSRDVTELRRMQERLSHQDKMVALGTLAAGLAHEIGNPLASMSSELEMLERMWDPEDARGALPVLREQVGRMARLLRELVELGRPPTDQVMAVEPRAVAEEVARLLRHDPRSKGATVEVRGEEADLVDVQRDGLVQVLVNLGLNALDAVGGLPAAWVELSVGVEGDELVYEVRDNGVGLAPEVIGQVFDPFFTTKEPGQGTGLGLFVSAQVMRRLGGRLDHVPTQCGSCFRVSLPLRPSIEPMERQP
jgi:C4-dicarboxylate-specific signal transduction histidine kinase